MQQGNNIITNRRFPNIDPLIKQYLSAIKGEHGSIRNELLERLRDYGITEKDLYAFTDKLKHILPQANTAEEFARSENSTLKKFLAMQYLLYEACAISPFGPTKMGEPISYGRSRDVTKKMSHPRIAGRKRIRTLDAFVNSMRPILTQYNLCYRALVSTVRRFEYLSQKNKALYTFGDIQDISQFFSELRVLFEDILANAWEGNINENITTNPAFIFLNQILQKSIKKDYLHGIPVKDAGIFNSDYFIPLEIFFLQVSIFLSHGMCHPLKQLLEALNRTTFKIDTSRTFRFELVSENISKKLFLEHLASMDHNSHELLSTVVFNPFYKPFASEEDYTNWINRLVMQCKERLAFGYEMLEFLKPYMTTEAPVQPTDQQPEMIRPFIITADLLKDIYRLNSLNIEIYKDKEQEFVSLDRAKISPLTYLKLHWHVPQDTNQTALRVKAGCITQKEISAKYTPQR